MRPPSTKRLRPTPPKVFNRPTNLTLNFDNSNNSKPLGKDSSHSSDYFNLNLKFMKT